MSNYSPNMEIRLVSPLLENHTDGGLSMLIEYNGDVLIWNFGRHVFGMLQRIEHAYGGLHVGPTWWAAGLARNCLLEGDVELAWVFLVIAAAGRGEFENPRLLVSCNPRAFLGKIPGLEVHYLRERAT
jgi:hypothetical protein